MAGAFFGIIAIIVALGALRYPLGSFTNMGPGLFPLLLGCALGLVAVAMIVQGLGDSARIDVTWAECRGLVCTIAAVVFFALALKHLGLNVTVLVASLIASVGSQTFRLRRALVVAVVIGAGCHILFLELLSLRLAAWPPFIGG